MSMDARCSCSTHGSRIRMPARPLSRFRKLQSVDHSMLALSAIEFAACVMSACSLIQDVDVTACPCSAFLGRLPTICLPMRNPLIRCQSLCCLLTRFETQNPLI